MMTLGARADLIAGCRQAIAEFCDPPSLVIFDVGEAEIVLRGALERSSGEARLPCHHLLDLPGELEVLVGDALGGMVHQADLDPGVGSGDVRVMPGRFRKMAD